ncbi:hypothetical protein [Bacillus gaemokensis]|uniref:Uncharacterized protein n=1 Tax=Bacillus gaemokensis TaxID=574375 RepID=A0A073KNG0_9BACI|nr:hypothetical protein [Bacillus gaemokensis]KEK23908.1 hypothetical protein BAGA_05620 [Bacillus gaemokensis]KYG38151.1 hypothetical protein AZF08_20605 [Bacillus gaemokensis]
MAVDKLERVKEEAYHTKSNPLGYETSLMDKKDFDYLVEQAEKVAKLESEIQQLKTTVKGSEDASRLDDLAKENEHLRNSLRRIKGRSSLIGKEIKNFYCNGYFGRRYDLECSIIMEVGIDHIKIRTTSGEFLVTSFDGDWDEYTDKMIAEWIGEVEDEGL